MTHETRSRLGCPLCRCPWPEEDQVPLSEIIAQLRLCRTRKVAKLAVKLETAFQQARRRRYKKCFAWYKSSWCKGCVYDRICIFMYRTIYSRDTHTPKHMYNVTTSCKKPVSLEQVKLRFDERPEVSHYRMGSAFLRLEKNLHSASSFLSHQLTGCHSVAQILSFLDARHVTNMSAACAPWQQFPLRLLLLLFLFL